MLPGLAIRQGFLALDLVLCVAVLGVAGLFVRGILEDLSGSGGGPVGPPLEVADATFYTVAARPEYQGIIDSGIFGKAASAKVDEEVEEPPPTEEEKVTDLQLRLLATTTTGPKDPLASAVIEVSEGARATRTFFINEDVIPNVSLVEVRPREVVLDNRNERTREILPLEENLLLAQNAGPSRITRPAAPSSPNRVTLNRDEFVRDLQVNYTDLITQVKPRYVKDAEGNVVGITSDDIENVALAQKLNLRNGDVLQTINNERIDSEEKIVEIVNKYRNATSFRLGIQRDGRSQIISYRLE